jgi:hypothetical protein
MRSRATVPHRPQSKCAAHVAYGAVLSWLPRCLTTVADAQLQLRELDGLIAQADDVRAHFADPELMFMAEGSPMLGAVDDMEQVGPACTLRASSAAWQLLCGSRS